MREIHVRTAPGRFAPCSECHTEPNHYIVQGRTQRETMRFDIPSVRHVLECRCGRSTGHHGSLHSAEADWGKRHSQQLLALPSPAHFARAFAAAASSPPQGIQVLRGAAHG